MRKQGFITVLTLICAVILCGAVSAADSSDEGGVLLDQSQDVDESVMLVDQSSQSVIDPIITVGVNYEISSDSGINPTISVEDSAGVGVELTKTYDSSDKVYSLTFDYPNVAEGNTFKVAVSAPGYVTEEQEVAVTAGNNGNFRGEANFNLEATAAYKLGREVTKKADKLLNFATADNVLCITTAGVPKLNGGTSEDCIEGILNISNGKITYGKGNLLMLRQTATDPVDFAFIIKKGSTLKAVCFRDGSSTPVYIGTISQNMEKIEWNIFIEKVGGENAFSFASLANAWAAGAPADLLREAAFHGHVCQGTISGYSITKALLKYYPPIQETSGGSGSPGDITSYKVLGVPGDSDDDAAMYFLDATPGKSGYAGFDTTSTGADTSMVGFIRWNSKTNSGDFIVMRFKRTENRQEFQEETGITLTGDLAELKFNSWIINKIKTNPEQLVEFIEEISGLNEEQYYYLLGTATDIKNADGTVRIPAQEAHGLDINYIKSLNLTAATRTTTSTSQGQLTYSQMKQIGVDAANLAKQIFKDELGIDLEKDDQNLAILTSAGYVHLNGQTTEATWDGIYQVLGSRLSRSNLLPVHTGLWKPLWFTFALRGADGQTMNSIYVRYDPSPKQFYVGSGSDGKEVNDIGPVALNDKNQITNLNKVYPDGNFFNIQSIANAWRNDPPFDQLVTFLFHDHACPGVQPGFFISDYISENYPLTEDQSYFYMGSSIYCKDDSLVYLLGISPGMGTYMNDRLMSSETSSEALPGGTEEGLLVVWDSKNNIGKAVVINFKWATLDMTGLTTSEAQREAQIAAYVSMYKGEPNSRVQVPTTTMTSDEKYITESEFKAIKEGGTATTSFLQYVKDLPVRSLSDLLADQGTDTNGDQNSNGDNNGQPYDGTDTSTDSSVGDSGLALTATLQATATEAGDLPGSTSSAHEITPVTSDSSSSSSWGVAAIVGVLVVLALGAFGFFWKGRGSA